MTTTQCRSIGVALLALLGGCDQQARSVADIGERRLAVTTADSIVVLAHESYSGYRESARELVADAAALAAAWRQVYALAEPRPDQPAVDFSADAVLVVAAGERPSGGDDIRIDSLLTLGSGTEVHVTTLRAGPTCVSTAALTQPVQVVRVPGLRAPVRFIEHVSVEECDLTGSRQATPRRLAPAPR